MNTVEHVQTLGQQAKNASALMAKASAADKNKALRHLAALLRENTEALQADNARDLARARAAGVAWAMDIDKVCTAAGIKPLTYPKSKREISPFETMAIGTLRKLILRHGTDEVAAALKHAAGQPGASEPGFWGSSAIEYAVGEWRASQGKRQEVATASVFDLNQRIRDLKAKGYSRFAIQAALRVKLADIEAAIGGAT